jgi:SpoVK/Ycf46/Vps4 family AAA+-type ATPase
MSNIKKSVRERILGSTNFYGEDISSTYKEDSLNTTNIKSFHYLEDGSVNFSILSTKKSTKKLDPGLYDINIEETRDGIKPILSLNKLKEKFNQDISYFFQDKINYIIKQFFNQDIKGKINNLGYNHKLGILLYGKAGTGKTSMFKKYFEQIIKEQNGIVFNVTDSWHFGKLWDFVQSIRIIQNNPIIVFIDEFDESFTKYDNEDILKTAMDGFSSIDNCLFMMATNYIDKIPKTIKDRKSRVKYCIEVKGIEDIEVIRKFLNDSFNKIELKIDFEEDLKKLKGKTLDEIKQYILDKIMDINPEIESNSSLGFK